MAVFIVHEKGNLSPIQSLQKNEVDGKDTATS